MKLLVEIEVSKSHPVLHSKRGGGEAMIIEAIKKQLAVLGGVTVKVTKAKAKK